MISHYLLAINRIVSIAHKTVLTHWYFNQVSQDRWDETTYQGIFV